MGQMESEAARQLGQIRSEKKREATQKNLEVARQTRWTEEARRAHAERMWELWASGKIKRRKKKRTPKTATQLSFEG